MFRRYLPDCNSLRSICLGREIVQVIVVGFGHAISVGIVHIVWCNILLGDV